MPKKYETKISFDNDNSEINNQITFAKNKEDKNNEKYSNNSKINHLLGKTRTITTDTTGEKNYSQEDTIKKIKYANNPLDIYELEIMKNILKYEKKIRQIIQFFLLMRYQN